MGKFVLTQADQDAIDQIDIQGDPSGFLLKGDVIQFPPHVSKDGKRANFTEHQSGSFEPLGVFKYADSRVLTIEFQWVLGGRFNAGFIHSTVSEVKGYFYHAYAGELDKYPAVVINKLYNLIQEKTTWRMDSVDITYSEEKANIGGWYPIHTKMTMNLKSATNLQPLDGGDGLLDASTLVPTVTPKWF